MKVGDKLYSPWWSLDIKDIEEYVIVGVDGDVVIVPHKVYSTNIRVEPSNIDKKLSCFFTTYENAIDNILYSIQKETRKAIKSKDKFRLEFCLDYERKFMEDIKEDF